MKTNSKKVKDVRAAYLCNIPISHGEITVVTSDSAIDTMRHSTRLAVEIAGNDMGVMLINCGMSKKRYTDHLVRNYPNMSKDIASKKFLTFSSIAGNLIGEQEGISDAVIKADVRVVIIAGWEFTSSNSRRRQNLIFFLRQLLDQEDVAIVIYAHCANQPVAGKIDKGGIGKLSMLSSFIAKLEMTEEFEDKIKHPKPMKVTGEDMEAAERSAQLLISKINGLGTHLGDSSSTSWRDIPNDGGGSDLVEV